LRTIALMPIFEKRVHIQAPSEVVFGFHERPDALERLRPPWENARVVERNGGLQKRARAVIMANIGPIKHEMTKKACEELAT